MPSPVVTEPTDDIEVYMFEQIESGPVIAADMAAAICRDPLFLRVAYVVLSGCWLELPSMSEYAPYVSRPSDLPLAQGCVMWGMKVVISAPLHQRCLNELHEDHLGVVKTKTLAQSLLWWPGLDADL